MTNTTLKIMADVYGSGMGIFDPSSILSASSRAADVIGVEAAKAELKAINRKRDAMLLPVACHPYGSRLF